MQIWINGLLTQVQELATISSKFTQTNYQKILKSKYNIWGEDLADRKLISKYNNGIRILLRVVDIFSKYAWAPLKEKNVTTMTHAFQTVLINLEKEVNQRKQDQIKVVNFKTGQ